MTGIDLSGLLGGLLTITWQQALMVAVGGLLMYLAIAKEYEPTLLLPIGFGCMLGNLPVSAHMMGPEGLFGVLKRAGIDTELFPLLIFLGVGAMMDMRPLLSQPIFVLMGALGHLGIFAALVVAVMLGFNLAEATAIGMIGAIDGPTVIYVGSKLGHLFETPGLAAAVAVTAYSYMSLVPIIQPPLMRLFTTKRERAIRMEYTPRPVSKTVVILFPIVLTLLAGIFLPQAAPLIATLMLGNLMTRIGRGGGTQPHLAGGDHQHRHPLPGVDHRLDDAGRGVPELGNCQGPVAGVGRLCAGYHRRHNVRETGLCALRAADQPAGGSSRHQRLPDERAAGPAGRAGGGQPELYPDARPRREHRRAGGVGHRGGCVDGADISVYLAIAIYPLLWLVKPNGV